MLIFVLSLVVTGCTNGTDNTQPVDQAVEENAEEAKDAAGDAVKEAEDSVREMTYEDIMVTPEDGIVVMDVEIGAMEYSYDMETEELIDDM